MTAQPFRPAGASGEIQFVRKHGPRLLALRTETENARLAFDIVAAEIRIRCNAVRQEHVRVGANGRLNPAHEIRDGLEDGLAVVIELEEEVAGKALLDRGARDLTVRQIGRAVAVY